MLIALATALAPSAILAEYSDCRNCHYTSIVETAPDFTGHFVDPGHHPVRVAYPATTDFNQPNGIATGYLFFDRNANGIADADEIQIFSSSALTTTSTGGTGKRSTKGGPKNAATESWIIDCASCHAEHGSTVPDPGHPADYVRMAGGGHLLCLTCHRL